MDYLIIFNNFTAIISFLVGVPSIIALSIKIYRYFCDIRYAKKILGFDKQPVQITQCIFEIEMKNYDERYYITHSSIIALNNTIELLNITGQKFYLIDNSREAINEINIGGFVANKTVSSYIKKYFPDFKFIIDSNNGKAYQQNPVDKDIFILSDNKKQFKIGKKILDMSDGSVDYAILIKLTKDDFKDVNKKTVHIVFGGGDLGTIKATEYLATNYKSIYRTFGKKHYFFALEVRETDRKINDSIGIMDFTNEMFIQ